ncbi:MAG: winged helix DNA-binding protein [Actinomyces sp.]|uniref:MarR family winged helix-turn-helix transcriptional regulator n=1 Tax=Actinomyces sp. TaxID=29317 RepID=UPI0026DCC363|nr:MarR family transcriptional regulator [Actinomyces sp.]MDO4243023.1 winged helix DNA-binding protein [Actinomyces sp.]
MGQAEHDTRLMGAHRATEQAGELADELLEHICGIRRPAGSELHGSWQGERAVLHHLDHTGSSSSPGELAQALRLSSARIANILKTLEHKGLIERLHDTRDRRRVLVQLTEHGAQTVARLKREALTALGGLIEALGEPDGAELVRIVGRIRSLIDAGAIAPPPPG